MKYICFKDPHDIEFQDAEYFINVNLESGRRTNLCWAAYSYRIEDVHADFLKIKYPDIVHIDEEIIYTDINRVL